MSKEAMEQFREAINGNKEWQEEVRNFGENDDMVSYAKGKGYEFSTEDYKEYRENEMVEELSDFELESIAGGKGVKDEDKPCLGRHRSVESRRDCPHCEVWI
tara:strand:- start:2884 stop:3189 length:306 start_codon:yes stop_codon:yes gene_type:complete